MALENIGTSILNWSKAFNKGLDGMEDSKRKSIESLKNTCDIRFLGYVEQQYIMKTIGETKRAVKAYEAIIK